MSMVAELGVEPIHSSGEHAYIQTFKVEETDAYDVCATRRLIRKVDFNLIPFLTLLYL